MDRELLSEEDTFLWLSRGDLKEGTESDITAAQDQALQTKYHVTKILPTATDGRCQQFDGTVEHIVSICSLLAKE